MDQNIMKLSNYKALGNKPYKVLLSKVDEIWKPMCRFGNEKPYYYISNYGRVYSIYSNCLIRLRSNSNGYMYLCAYNEDNSFTNIAIHRAVLETFNPINNCQLYDVNHKDGNKSNNSLDNLEWVTRSQNVIHAFNNGLSKRGSDHPNSIYTDQFIHLICKYLEEGKSGPEIISLLESNYSYRSLIKLISKIKTKKTWKHISCLYKI